MNPNTLIIRHNSETSTFQVVRLRDAKTTPNPVEIPAPGVFAVEGRPNSSLSMELRWYLERFLDFPFHPDTDLADRVQDAMKAWGSRAFDALFGDRDGALMLAEATRDGFRITCEALPPRCSRSLRRQNRANPTIHRYRP